MGVPTDPEKYELWRQRQRAAQIGKRGPNKKKRGHLSDEHKRKLGEKSRGRKASDETLAKMSISHKLRHANTSPEKKEERVNKYKKWYHSLSAEEKLEFLKPWIDAGMKQNGSVSKKEKQLREYFISKGSEFETQVMIGQYYVDFLVRSNNLIIEFNGCYYHQCEECGHNKGVRGFSAEYTREYDRERIEFLKSQGYKVIVVWEHDLEKILNSQ